MLTHMDEKVQVQRGDVNNVAFTPWSDAVASSTHWNVCVCVCVSSMVAFSHFPVVLLSGPISLGHLFQVCAKKSGKVELHWFDLLLPEAPAAPAAPEAPDFHHFINYWSRCCRSDWGRQDLDSCITARQLLRTTSPSGVEQEVTCRRGSWPWG